MQSSTHNACMNMYNNDVLFIPNLTGKPEGIWLMKSWQSRVCS